MPTTTPRHIIQVYLALCDAHGRLAAVNTMAAADDIDIVDAIRVVISRLLVRYPNLKTVLREPAR